MYMKSLWSIFLTLTSILKAEKVVNDMALNSILENDNYSTEDVISCINEAVQANEEKYIDMLYFELFSDYIDNPCNEIKQIWFDDLDIGSNDMVNAMVNNINDISELVNLYPALFNLIYTWFDNNLFTHDPESHIQVALDIISWLNNRKSHYNSVDDWCDPSWKTIGLEEYSNIATKCFLISSSNDIINTDVVNPPLIRRLVGDNNSSLSEKLENAKDFCLDLINKNINIALQLSFQVQVPMLYKILGLAPIEIGIGAYLTLDGIVDVSLYFTYAFGLGVYVPRATIVRDINIIFFQNGNSGSDYMGPNFAVEAGFYAGIQGGAVSFGIGINAMAIFNWKPVKFIGWSIGLEKAWSYELRVEFEPIMYNRELLTIFNVDLSEICDKIPQTNNTNGTIFDDDLVENFKNKTINLFYDAKDWSIAQGNWDIITSSFQDNNTISSILNVDTSTDNIIWIGDNNEDSLNWESYSVTVDLQYDRTATSLNGFIFGAKTVNDAYFYGISSDEYTFGYFKAGSYIKIISGTNSRPLNGQQTLKSTLYSNGSVVLALDQTELNREGELFISDNFDLSKGSVGLRTNNGGSGVATYTRVIVKRFEE